MVNNLRQSCLRKTARKKAPHQKCFSGGGRWIRTTEVRDNRFTVCPLWPLGNSPVFYCIFQSKKALNGAGEGNRTPNLLITNQLLCQLSYTSISAVLYHAALRFFLPSALRRMILYHFAVLLSIPFCDFFRTFEKNFIRRRFDAAPLLFLCFLKAVPCLLPKNPR